MGTELLESYEARKELAFIQETPGDVVIASRGDEIQGVVLLRERHWDSGHFGIRVGSIEVLRGFGRKPSHNRDILSSLMSFVSAKLGAFRYVTCRTTTRDQAAANILESFGFEYLTGMVTLGFHFAHDEVREVRGSNISAVRKGEVSRLAGIARRSFVCDRFHQETGLPKSNSDSLHAEWIRNCCLEGLADTVLVSRDGRTLQGFVACRLDRELHPTVGEIVLLGVAPEMRGKGVGSRLVNAALRWFDGLAELVLVRTEVSNYPSLRTYQKENFTILSASNYFRRWM
ncbi:MAG: GNAT family N-acetyltransferase [Acidobacteriota bacterium]